MPDLCKSISNVIHCNTDVPFRQDPAIWSSRVKNGAWYGVILEFCMHVMILEYVTAVARFFQEQCIYVRVCATACLLVLAT